MAKKDQIMRVATFFLAVIGCLVGAFLWFGASDRLPSPGSKDACAVFLERLRSEGVSERTYRACKNAFPKGMTIAELGGCLNEASKVGLGMGNRRFYQFFNGEEREAHAQIWITVDGDPPRVENHSIEEPVS